MAPFKIQPHNRLQEWVAEEKGYFTTKASTTSSISTAHPTAWASGAATVSTAQARSRPRMKSASGAFETMEAGRTCDISAACHWAVNMAASGQHGKMWGHAYSVTPAGIYVAADSAIRKPEDLAGREVGVGYHSGSHFSALQALEAFLPARQTRD